MEFCGFSWFTTRSPKGEDWVQLVRITRENGFEQVIHWDVPFSSIP